MRHFNFIFIAIAGLLSGVQGNTQTESTLLIGTYTQTGSYGIYVARFNEQTGVLRVVDSAKADNPSYLCIAPSGKKVYALSENGGSSPGSVSAFTFDKASGKLTFINSQLTGGDHPCYVSIDEKGKFLAVANYTGGSVSMIPVDASGALLPLKQLVQHAGSGPNTQRQEKPHVHQSVFAPRQNFVVVNDLGTDEIKAYPYSPKKPMPLDTQKVIKIKAAPGSGPRHLAFHPGKPIFYVMEELSGNVSVHAFNKHSIALLQTIKSDTISSQPGSADIHISADGRFLYASNRAEANNISIFSIGAADGRLQRIGAVPVNGKVPRNFVVHPTGKWLLVANQASNNIVVFARNEQTGMLTPTGGGFGLPTPVCLVFAE